MHVVTQPPEPFLACDGALRVHVVPAARDNLVFVAECLATSTCAVVDGPGAAEVRAYCEAAGLSLSTIWNTHTHGDHIGINRELPGLEVVGPARAAAAVPGLTRGVDEGDTVSLGALTARVMLTEGHLNGHISYVLGDVVFCGDTLFAGGCGYLFDGPADVMFRSLLRLAELDGATRVCCAHEYTEDNLAFARSVEPDNPELAERSARVAAIRAAGGCTVPSTIDEERATNPFLRPGSPSLRARVAEQLPSADLSTPAATFAATRALKDLKLYRAGGQL